LEAQIFLLLTSSDAGTTIGAGIVVARSANKSPRTSSVREECTSKTTTASNRGRILKENKTMKVKVKTEIWARLRSIAGHIVRLRAMALKVDGLPEGR
jgi:hypothetical protein